MEDLLRAKEGEELKPALGFGARKEAILRRIVAA